MRITVIGTGYVGLVTGACLAEMGNDVFCLDVDQAKIDLLNQDHIPIHEPGLEELVRRNRSLGRLQFSTDVSAGVAHGDVQFIAVGTPPGEDGAADLGYVLDAAANIGRYMVADKIVVTKSTVPVGTGEAVLKAVRAELSRRSARDPGLAIIDATVISNPEFLKEGAAVADFMRPDRLILGVDANARGATALRTMQELYAPFNRNHDRMLVMDVRSAELTKYAANAMLATRISFMNELANLADEVGADIEHVRRGIGADPRIGYDFLYAGTGYGGSCFPKDVRALIRTAEGQGRKLQVLSAVEAVNDGQKRILVDKIVTRFGDDLSSRTFAVWGLAFKPNTDDMREAPSRVVIRELTDRGARIRAFDPVAMEEARRSLRADGIGESMLTFCSSQLEALRGADALVIMTEWKSFRSPDFGQIREALRFPVIFDGRNLFEPAAIAKAGIEYWTVGRSAHVRKQ